LHGQGGRQPETEAELRDHIDFIEAERPLNSLEEKLRADQMRKRDRETAKCLAKKRAEREKATASAGDGPPGESQQ